MTQPSLFGNEEPAGKTPDAADARVSRMSRRTDPVTSHRAAAAAEASGTVGRHEEMILEALAKRDGMTSEEIAELAGLDRVAAARRMKRLEELGRVRRGEPRLSAKSGRPGVVWWLVKTNEVRQ